MAAVLVIGLSVLLICSIILAIVVGREMRRLKKEEQEYINSVKKKGSRKK